MNRSLEAHKRLIFHYLAELEKLEISYQKGENILARFSSRHGNWNQIKSIQQWASRNRATDKTALEMCSDYIDRTPNLLNALLDQNEHIKWLQTARDAARLLKRIETEIAHLGNIAITYRNMGQHSEAISPFEELHKMIQGRDDIEEANVLCMLGECYRITGRYEDATNALKTALALAKDRPFVLKPLTYQNLGVTYRNQGDIALCIDYHKKEAEIAEKENDLARVSGSFLSLGIAYYERLEIDKALECYTQALAVIESEQFRDSIQSAYIYHVRSDTHKAELVYGIATENWQKFNRYPILGNRGVAEAAIGQFAAALDSIQQAITGADDISNRHYQAIWKYRKGTVYHALGEYEKAVQYYKDSLEIAKADNKRRAVGFALAGLGKTQLARVYLDPTHKDLEFTALAEAFRIAMSINNPRDIQEWGASLVEAHLYTGRLDNARNVISEILHRESPENKFHVVTLLGLIEALRGNQAESARREFREALTIMDELLSKTPRFLAVKYARGLALSGLATLSDGNERKTYIAQAQEAYHEARSISDAKGVVSDALRLLNVLKPIDSENVLIPILSSLN